MTNKIKFPLYVAPDTMTMVEENMEAAEANSKTEYIEKAIRFYSRYISTGKSSDYYPVVITDTIHESYGYFENRMASLMFKLAVEIDMMMHTIAANNEIDLQTLSRLRGECVKEVKNSQGKVDFDKVAYRYY